MCCLIQSIFSFLSFSLIMNDFNRVAYAQSNEPFGIAPAVQTSILNLHNEFRRNISKTYGATNMMKMVWDDQLAASAYNWALHYEFQHNHFADRYIKGFPGLPTGQNMCLNSPDWPSCIQKWFDEEEDFRYGAAFNELNYGSVGHFVQIAYWKSARVGCGYATCGCYKYFVCEYAEALLFTPTVYSPWSEGEPCADCPDRCDDGLCDCSGKLCSNMGELKVDTCDCVCYTQAYSGSKCQNLDCAVPDDFMCAQLNVTYCRDVPNVYSLCPTKCSRCDE